MKILIAMVLLSVSFGGFAGTKQIDQNIDPNLVQINEHKEGSNPKFTHVKRNLGTGNAVSFDIEWSK